MVYLARQVEAPDKERVDAGAVNSGPTAVTGGEPETAVEILTPGATTMPGVEPEVSGIPPSTPESRLCTWIECSQDKRSWAEVQEEERAEVIPPKNKKGALSCTPVPARVAEASPKVCLLYTSPSPRD